MADTGKVTCMWLTQARVEEVGQALLRRTQDAGGVGPRRKGKRSRFHMDAYEEHMPLPDVSTHLNFICSVLQPQCTAVVAHSQVAAIPVVLSCKSRKAFLLTCCSMNISSCVLHDTMIMKDLT